MEKLPLEITATIFSGLPIVSKLQCREVCKTWATSLPKPKLGLLYEIEAQFYFSEQNNNDNVSSTNHVDEQLHCLGTLNLGWFHPSESFLVGSCNGLVCYAGLNYHKFYGSRRLQPKQTCTIRIFICNPVTGEHIRLPDIHWRQRFLVNAGSNPAIGFGYNRVSNEYKVVVLRDNIDRDVQVYTLLQGGTVWRDKNGDKHFLSQLKISPSQGVFAGGALHWIDDHYKVIAFSLEHERFKLLPLIPSVSHGAKQVRLMLLGGNLCALEVVPSNHIMIWELSNTQKRGSFVPDWVTKFTLAWEDYSWFHAFALAQFNTAWEDKGFDEFTELDVVSTAREDYKCLLWYNAVLSCYDSETKTLRKLDETLKKFMGDCTSVYTTNRAIPHVNSLVSLEAVMKKKVGMKRKAHEEIE